LRKKALKLKYPSRNAIYKNLRKKNNIKMTIDSQGHEIALNLKKHLLFQKPYKNTYYQNELNRFQQYEGDKK